MKTALLSILLALALNAQRRDLTVEAVQKHALVIGNSTYPQFPLRNPTNDANAMNAVLSELGFQTEAALNVSLRALDAAVNRLITRVRSGDTVVFYYAGHGMQLEGENYLIPIDFNARDEADAKYVSYNVSRIQDRLERAGARVTVMILDACRNNPFQATRSAGGGLASMGSGKGTLIALATSPGKTAYDNPRGDNGLFTSHLIQAMREPGLSLDQVFNRVRERVYNESQGRQLPWTVSSVIGDIYLKGGSTLALAPSSNPIVRNNNQAQPPVNPLSRQSSAPPPVQYSEPAPPAFDATATLRDGNSALERGDNQDAIAKAQSILRVQSTHKEALLLLTFALFKTQDWVPFVSTAKQAIAAGNAIPFLLGHHHTLTGAHPVTLTLTKQSIAFKSLGGACNQTPFEYPLTSMVSAGVVNSVNGDILLNFRIKDEKDKQKNMNFTDSDVQVIQDPNGLPKLISPPKANAQLQAVAAVLQGVR
ncbi:MAG: caspase family protein [Chloroflexia bacterium]